MCTKMLCDLVPLFSENAGQYALSAFVACVQIVSVWDSVPIPPDVLQIPVIVQQVRTIVHGHQNPCALHVVFSVMALHL